MVGIIPYTTGASLPWTTPFFFSGWLATGHLIAGFWQIILIAIDCLIYYPFFKVMDRQFLAEEEKPVQDLKDDLDDISLDDLSFDDL